MDNSIKISIIAALTVVAVAAIWLNSTDAPQKMGEASLVYTQKGVVSSTTTVPIAKRSLYWSYPTSTDVGGYYWVYTSSTDGSGTPWVLLEADPGRYAFTLYGLSKQTFFWIESTTSTSMSASNTSTDAYVLDEGEEWKSVDYGIRYTGPVYALASSTLGSSTVRTWVFK